MSYLIHDLAKIVGKENLTVGDHSQIDDFVFLNAGKGTRIGRYVHIASFCSVIGGGEFQMDDFSGLSAGCRIITGSDDFLGRALTNPTVPGKYTRVKISCVHIKRHAILGTNAIVFPGVTIGEGAAVGAGCIVRKSLDPWFVYSGENCTPIRKRPSETILRLEQELLSEPRSPC